MFLPFSNWFWTNRNSDWFQIKLKNGKYDLISVDLTRTKSDFLYCVYIIAETDDQHCESVSQMSWKCPRVAVSGRSFLQQVHSGTNSYWDFFLLRKFTEKLYKRHIHKKFIFIDVIKRFIRRVMRSIRSHIGTDFYRLLYFQKVSIYKNSNE